MVEKIAGIGTARTLASTIGLTEDEWRKQRRLGIGGSDIAAICGKNPWRTSLDVYLDKIEKAPDVPEKEAMRWGKVLEPVVANEFTERTKLKTEEVHAILQHAKHDWALANIDRLVIEPGDNGILEIKTTGWGGDWEEGIPDHVMLQVLWYLGVTGLSHSYVAALIKGQKLLIPDPIQRDDETIGYLFHIAEQFVKNIENRIPPEPDGSRAATEIMKRLYQKGKKGTIIDLPNEAWTLICEYNEAKELEKAGKDRKAEAENKLKNMLKENETGLVRDHRISWTTFDTNRFDLETFKAEHPDVYENYLRVSTSRRFNVGLVKTKSKGIRS